MSRTSFNDGWTVTPKLSGFEALTGGAAPRPVRLPHDGARDLERRAESGNGSHTGYWPGAALAYEKAFEVPADWLDKSVTLELEGAYRDAMVFVNGDFVGQRPHGYTGFALTIDPYLREGSNTVRVDVRSYRDSRWYTGTGISRDTWLTVTDPVHIPSDGVRVSTPEVDAALAVLQTAVTLVNDSRRTRTVQVLATAFDASGADVARASAPVTLLPGERATATMRLSVASPALWSPDDPVLYRLRAAVREADRTLDETETTFGIRTLRLDPVHGLRINGQPITLRGGCVHHDNGPLGSAAIPRAEERRVQILKDAGYNAIRSAHNPLSRAFIDACDRLGMLVMDEFSDVWTEGKTPFDYAVSFPEWWERDIEAMVAKDFNHPSVIMYSIGNEIFEVGRPIGSRWGRQLAAKVRSLDGTRYVTNAINGLVAAMDVLATTAGESAEPSNLNAMIASMGDLMNHFGASDVVSQRTEESHAQLDISGINYAEARYAVDAGQYPNRIEVGSETFPGALDRLWPEVLRHPHVLGDFAWTAWDYLGEVGIGRAVYANDPDQPTGIASPFPWLAASVGTVDITGFRRPIAYWRQVVWGLRDEPYIAVHRPQRHDDQIAVGPWAWDDVVSSWSWDVQPGSPVRVDVYTDADEVELQLDGNPIGRARVGVDKGCIARFETTYRPGELVAVALRAGRAVARTSLRSAIGAARLDMAADRRRIAADGSDLAYIDITLRDGSGVLMNDARAVVTLQVEGPAKLAGYASARPDTEERFDADTRTSYDGRLLAVVRPTGPGRIRVSAAADGLDGAVVEIEALD